jgi:two-component system chemotaxis sensor kinase CheA
MDEQLLEIFRGEATERLDRMTAALAAAERGPIDAATIDVLFRDAHSLKGGAAMMGFGEIGALAATMEAILAPARDAGAVAADALPALVGGVEAIRAAVAGDASALEPAAAALARLG